VSSSSESSRDERRKKKKKKSKEEDDIHWDLVNDMWPLEQRPARLQSRKVVCRMKLKTIQDYKTHFEKEEENKGTSASIFGRDQKPKKIKLAGGSDDCFKKLSQARFDLRLPLCPPADYWSRLPQKRALYRHLPLAHLGLEGQISEKVVLAMHDRRNVVKLEMFYKNNACKDKSEKEEWALPSEIKHIQEAVLSYVVTLQALWPLDYAGLVINKVLIEAKWGEVAGADEKARSQLVIKFFNETVKENSGRAVREEVPLTYEEAKARWSRTVEDLYPHLTVLGLLAKNNQQYLSTGARGVADSRSRGRGRGRGRGATSTSTSNGAATGGTPVVRQVATLGGLQVCYAYNSTTCQRPAVKQNVCKDAKGTHYAHACNWLDKATGKFCLQAHPRNGNH